MRRALMQLSESCDVRMVSDGVELIEYLGNGTESDTEAAHPAPDLIIVDLKMPRKDGRQALLAITGELEITTPVVVFSGSDDSSDIAACYRAGCNSFVTKPVELQPFNRVVQMIATYWLALSKLPHSAM
jgi:CheY-like chemotaxis protein